MSTCKSKHIFYDTFLVIFKQSVSIYKMNVSFINQALFEKSYLICSLRYVLILPRASTPVYLFYLWKMGLVALVEGNRTLLFYWPTHVWLYPVRL